MKMVFHLKNKKGKIDFGCILLLLLAGCLFISDTWQYVYWIFIPRQPVLWAMDWKGSVMEDVYTDTVPLHNSPNTISYTVYLSRTYDRDYFNTANLMQITMWYPDAQDAKHAWEDPQETINKQSRVTMEQFSPTGLEFTSFLKQFHAKSLPSDISIPSSLLCYNDSRYVINNRTCVYFGYYKNWFTQIWIREEKNLMSDEEMYELIRKAAQILLCAERSAKGSGRIYTITYSAQDASGNITLKSVVVTVPHNH
jgi:hypothetical protein